MGNFLFPPLGNDKSEFQSGTVRELCNCVVVRFMSKIRTEIVALEWLCRSKFRGRGEKEGERERKKSLWKLQMQHGHARDRKHSWQELCRWWPWESSVGQSWFISTVFKAVGVRNIPCEDHCTKERHPVFLSVCA